MRSPVCCRFGQQGGIPRRLTPILTGLREEVEDGKYTLVRGGCVGVDAVGERRDSRSACPDAAIGRGAGMMSGRAQTLRAAASRPSAPPLLLPRFWSSAPRSR